MTTLLKPAMRKVVKKSVKEQLVQTTDRGPHTFDSQVTPGLITGFYNTFFYQKKGGNHSERALKAC